MVTFAQGVASLTGSYSMAVRPIEEHPCVLRGKGSQIKYATRWLRAHLNAKPNIAPISAKEKYGVTWYGFNPTFCIRWTLIFILELSNICFFNYAEFVCYLSSEFAFGSLRDRLIMMIFFWGGGVNLSKVWYLWWAVGKLSGQCSKIFRIKFKFLEPFFLLCPLYRPIWEGEMSPLFVATICGD